MHARVTEVENADLLGRPGGLATLRMAHEDDQRGRWGFVLFPPPCRWALLTSLRAWTVLVRRR
jgi:hypothetical protein